MIQYFLERPYLIAILAAVILLTLFVCFKAAQASARRTKGNEALIKKMKEENELRNEFAVLTQTLAAKSEPDRLFRGVALNLQKKVHDAADMEDEFASFTQEQREIYALSFVVEDGGEKLSGFFRASGQPLTGEALNAFRRLFDGRALEIFETEYNAFDPENETQSMIPDEIEKLDAEFASLLTEKEICTAAGNFMKKNYID